MAQLLRGKQSGVQKDLSAGLDPGLFNIDDIARYGINSQISTVVYDPVQSLLAVGTNESQFGGGQIYLYGKDRVSLTLSPPRKSSITILQFCADKLVSVDSKNDFTVYSLINSRVETSYAPPSVISALITDPALDFALLGLQNGASDPRDLMPKC